MDELGILEAINFLDALSREMIEQETDSQADPRFWVVAENKREYGIASGYQDGEVVCDNDGGTFEAAEELMEHLIENEYLRKDAVDPNYTYSLRGVLELLGNDDFQIVGYADTRNVIAANTMFLTKRECQEHIKKNHYHYKQPHTYAMTAWRSPQVEQLYRTLKEIDWSQLRELLNRRHSPKPEALTLEQLRDMVGEPVYIVDFNHPNINRWTVLEADNIKYDLAIMDDDTDYGVGWLAYATKPETEAK